VELKKNISCQRRNIKEIILCHENKSDIDEIKPRARTTTFHYVKEMSEVLKIAITDQNVKTPKHCKVFSAFINNSK
jgi:ATP-dependent Lon protease